MNLVLSGPIDDNLRNEVATSVKPRNVVRLHAKAYRFEGADDSPCMRHAIADLCDASRVDHAFVKEGLRFSDFKLLAMDMDSTLITIECVDEIADFAGKKNEVAAITEAAMRGEITDFSESLRRRVQLFAGLRDSVLLKVYNERLKYSPGASNLVDAANANNIYSLIVSGGFKFFADRVAKELQVSKAISNDIVTRHGRLTGTLRKPIIDGERKQMVVLSEAKALSCSTDRILTIGDGANDVPMMCIAGYSIAYRAKPAAIKVASSSIAFGDLSTTLDYLS